MKIRPLHDCVVVRRKDAQETSAGGIVLAGTAKDKPNEGEVIAIGNGKVLDNGKQSALSVKIGDKVIFGRYAASDTLILDDEELIIMRESDIYGVVEP
ncbi:MAG: chaperonin GroES [Cellvibrionaceae bacterium]|jgi:chaperonin GroES